MPATVYPEAAYHLYVVPELLRDGTLIYVAWHPELPRVLAHGPTPEAAEQSLSEAFAIYQGHALKHGLEIPPPRSYGVGQAIWRVAVTGSYKAASPIRPITRTPGVRVPESRSWMRAPATAASFSTPAVESERPLATAGTR